MWMHVKVIKRKKKKKRERVELRDFDQKRKGRAHNSFCVLTKRFNASLRIIINVRLIRVKQLTGGSRNHHSKIKLSNLIK